MSAERLQFEQFQRDRASRGLGRLLNPAPSFSLHPSGSTQREQVEQTIYDQFQANHGASIREFMPVLLTMSCHHKYTATAGIRSAAGHNLFLEQYLPETVENAIGRLAGEVLERRQIAEIGNLVATQRGSSQLLFLILSVVLKQAGFDWLVFTATPQVYKTINRLGFELYALGDADPSLLEKDSLDDWGSYYDSQPRIVAGNLSEAMEVLAERKIYTQLISLYQSRIDALSSMIRQNSFCNEQYSFAA